METEPVRRTRVVERDVFENDALAEARQGGRAGRIGDGLGMVQILEDLLRCAQGLLEDVVDAHQALQRLQQHDEREHEAGEIARGEQAGADLDARVGQQRHDGERGAEIDHGRREPLLQNVARVVLEQALRGFMEAAGFVFLGGEGLHHHVAAERFLKDLVELGLAVLRAAAGAPDAAAHPHGGQHHGGQHDQAHQGQPPVVTQQNEEQENGGKELAQQVGQNLGSGHLHLIDIVHDGRHQLAGGMRFKEFGALFEHLVEHRVAQIGDRREAGVADQVVAQIIANAFDEEGGEDGDRDHGPDGAAMQRDQVVQIELVVQDGVGQERDAAFGRVGG